VKYIEVLSKCLDGKRNFCGAKANTGKDLAHLFVDFEKISETIDPQLQLSPDARRELNEI